MCPYQQPNANQLQDLGEILSFHLLIETGWNRVLAGGVLGEDDLRAMEGASGLILPQGCRRGLYQLARRHCKHVFPDYGARFLYPGKTGQAGLFAEYTVPRPEQVVLNGLADYSMQSLPFPIPLLSRGHTEGKGIMSSL